ncbi:uncharacterized protein NPIL_402131 [Nephila pilipes]|uniref:Uncharacterized protein n=1 Tax=Nephila pilipes TaxID=299642 RepID=A0A8X6TSC5_NEPPI|nr:uncharacterized protein NPIL_402131 [Nephila pilipes]
MDSVKASQLVASVRGSAAEILQGIPGDKLTDLTTIEKALESQFERLMSFAYAECPLNVRESLAAQYLVDVIRDEDTRHLTSLMDAKDLESALAYNMKYETAKTVSKT